MNPYTHMETLSDVRGTVTFGWLSESIFYARSWGSLSAELGTTYAYRLQTSLLGAVRVRLFSDEHALIAFDPIARAAFANVVLANSWRLAAVAVLASREGADGRVQALSRLLGAPIGITLDPAEFQAHLHRVAPFALAKLEREQASNPVLRREPHD